MHDKDLYKKFLGIDKPWFISQVAVDDATLTIEVLVEFRCGASGDILTVVNTKHFWSPMFRACNAPSMT